MEGKLSEVMASTKNERDSKKTIFEHAAYVSSLSSSLISLMYVVLVVDSWSRPAAVVFVGQWGLLTQCEPIVLVSVTQRGDNGCSFCPFDDFSYEFLIFLPFTTFCVVVRYYQKASVLFSLGTRHRLQTIVMTQLWQTICAEVLVRVNLREGSQEVKARASMDAGRKSGY